MTVGTEWQSFRRQPLSAFLVVLLSTGIKILKAFWPFLLVAIFNNKKGSAYIYFLLLGGIPAVIIIIAVLNYLYFKFRLIEGNLVVKHGILKKEQIAIPLSNIQGVNIDQNWLHKIIGLARVAVDSPGTEKAEIKINLKMQTAIQLKEMLLAANSIEDSVDLSIATNVISRLSAKDLFKLGLSANHIETLFLMIGLGFSFYENIKDVFTDQLEKFYKASTVSLINGGIAFFVYATIFVLFISVIVSFIRIVIKYANFAITKTDKGFSIRSGLINSVEHLISFDKVQFVSWNANWVRKQIPLFMVEYHSIGVKHLERKLKVKMPVPSTTLLNKLVGIYSDGIAAENEHLRISKKYIFRRTLFFGILPCMVIGGIAVNFVGLNVLWVLLIPVLVYFTATLFYRNFKLYCNEELVHIRTGSYGKAEILIKWQNIQSVKIVQNYYQQHNALASVAIYSAGGLVKIPYIQEDAARMFQNYALFKIESEREKKWM